MEKLLQEVRGTLGESRRRRVERTQC
jgi:hypothetical protein